MRTRFIGLNLYCLFEPQAWNSLVALRKANELSGNSAAWHGYCTNIMSGKETAVEGDSRFLGWRSDADGHDQRQKKNAEKAELLPWGEINE